MSIRPSALYASIVIMMLFAVAGCTGSRKTKPDLAPLPISLTSTSSVGGLLGDAPAAATIPALSAESAWIVDCRIIAAPPAADMAFVPLGSRARLVTARRGDEAVLASTRLTIGTQLAVVDALPAGQAAQEYKAAVAPGITSTFHLAAGRSASPESVDLQLHLPAAGSMFQLGIAAAGTVAIESADETDESKVTQVQQREQAVVDDLAIKEGGGLRILIPWKFTADTAPRPVLVEMVFRAAAQDASSRALLTKLEHDLSAAASGPAAPPASPEMVSARSLLDSTIPLLSQEKDRRRAVVFLSAQTDAPVCQDVALVADDATLQKLAQSIAGQVTASTRMISAQQWGFLLDLCALRLLGELQSAGKVPDELESVLLRHAGEAGRRAGAIEEAIRDVPTRADLVNRLVAENLISLEDNSPASRVRAFDWLRTRNRAPAGFDPLASPRDRQLALERAATEQTQR